MKSAAMYFDSKNSGPRISIAFNNGVFGKRRRHKILPCVFEHVVPGRRIGDLVGDKGRGVYISKLFARASVDGRRVLIQERRSPRLHEKER
jgi:hypothetical protein